MARNARAGLCIGVLTGSGTPDQLLATGADLILPNVGHIPKLLSLLFEGEPEFATAQTEESQTSIQVRA